MPEPRRGEVWYGDLDPTRGHEQAGTRPVLIVSDNNLNSSAAGLVIAVPFTTRERRVPFHVEVQPPEGGLKQRSFAKCEDVRSLSVERLKSRIGYVTEETLKAVEFHLKRLLRIR